MENQLVLKSKLTSEELNFYQSVIVLNCGGTINMSGSMERKPSNAVDIELKKIKEKFLDLNIQYLSFDVFDRAPDSSNIQNKDWDKIFDKILEILNRKKRIEEDLQKIGAKFERGGIVLTHGTDTLQLTCLSIAYKLITVDFNLPIIFTASHAPIGEFGSDASENIQKSIFSAKEKYFDEENSLPAGVYALIGQEIHLASRISKIYTTPNSEGKYFFSFPAPVANITMGKKFKIKVNKKFISRIIFNDNPLLKIKVKEVYNWGIVEHIVIDKFTTNEILIDFKRRVNFYNSLEEFDKSKIGLVIQGNFLNNELYSDLEKLLIELVHSEVVIFLGSKVIYTKILGKYDDVNIGLIHKSISHSKARLKLSWLLRLNIDTKNIINLMNTNLVGDIFDTDELPEWINYETFPDNIEGHEVIIAYPNIHQKVFSDVINRLLKSQTKKRKINIYGFGDGHLPTSNDSIINIYNRYLTYKNIPVVNLSQDATINEIIKSSFSLLQKHITADFLLKHYHLDQNIMSTLIKRVLAQKIREEHMETLKKVISVKLKELQSSKSIIINNQTHILKEILLNAKIQLWKEEIDEKHKKLLIEYEENYFNLMVNHLPQYVIQRILKDSLMHECKLLKQIGIAIDNDIRFFINTTAVKSVTNTAIYENGNKLMIIGVDSKENNGWDTSYLRPK